MKKLIVALASTICLFSFTAVAGADVSYDITAGLGIPFGDLGDFAGTGFGVGTDVFFWSPENMPAVKVGGRVAFTYFTEDIGTATAIEFMPIARYDIPTSGGTRFFAQGGIGFAHLSTSFDNPTYSFGGVTYGGGSSSDSEMEFGVALGGGVAFDWQNREVFFMPVLNLISDAEFFGLNVGMTLK